MIGGVFIFLRDVVRILCIFVFFLCSLHYPLVHQSCDHLLITYIVLISHLYIWWCMLLFTYLSMCCFFSIFIHMFLYVCNLLFLFHTKMSWWVLFKVFQKDKLSKSIMPWLSSCKVFQEFVIGLDFIVFNKWLWVYCI